MKRFLPVVCLVVAAGILVSLAGCHGSGILGALVRHDITAAQLQAMMLDGQPLLLIDVRTYEEFTSGHIPDSLNLPLDDIEEWKGLLDKQMRTCCICGVGGRSQTAADTLVADGFLQVYNLLGGMNGWTGDVEEGCGCD